MLATRTFHLRLAANSVIMVHVHANFTVLISTILLGTLSLVLMTVIELRLLERRKTLPPILASSFTKSSRLGTQTLINICRECSSQRTLAVKRKVMQEATNINESFYFYEPSKGHGLPHDPFKSIIAPRPIVTWLDRHHKY
jgi:hypothetical protein